MWDFVERCVGFVPDLFDVVVFLLRGWVLNVGDGFVSCCGGDVRNLVLLLDFGDCCDLGLSVATPVGPEKEQNWFSFVGWVEVGSGFAFEGEYVDGLLAAGLEREGFGFCEVRFEQVESLVAFALAREETRFCFDRCANGGAEESVFLGVSGDDSFSAVQVGGSGCRLV